MSVAADGRTIVQVCSYCKGSREQTESLAAKGYAVSHGICPSCWPEARRLMGLPAAPYPGGGR